MRAGGGEGEEEGGDGGEQNEESQALRVTYTEI